jgi:hypothetical protein
MAKSPNNVSSYVSLTALLLRLKVMVNVSLLHVNTFWFINTLKAETTRKLYFFLDFRKTITSFRRSPGFKLYHSVNSGFEDEDEDEELSFGGMVIMGETEELG